jgi:hypothetical protein
MHLSLYIDICITNIIIFHSFVYAKMHASVLEAYINYQYIYIYIYNFFTNNSGRVLRRTGRSVVCCPTLDYVVDTM